MSADDPGAEAPPAPPLPPSGGSVAWVDLALAQEVFSRNLQQLEAVSHQQAANILRLAFLARAVALIDRAGSPEGSQAIDQMISDFNRIQAQFSTPPAAAVPPVPASSTALPTADTRSLAMTLPEEVVNAVAIGNLKAIAEQPAMLANLAHANLVANTNLAQQNAVANQQAMNELGISVVAKAANIVTNLGPLEARSAVDVLSNNELADLVAGLKAAIQAFARPEPAKP